MFGFTCNYCGETLRGDEYVDHINMHDREDGTPPKRDPYASTRQEARDTWTDHARDMDPRY